MKHTFSNHNRKILTSRINKMVTRKKKIHLKPGKFKVFDFLSLPEKQIHCYSAQEKLGKVGTVTPH